GSVENYKYNFYIGFKKAASLYENLGVSVQYLPEYQQGFNQGAGEGREIGLKEGESFGSSRGLETGRREARNRFKSAVDNETNLDITLGHVPDGSDFPGLDTNLANPDFPVLLKGYNDEYYQNLRSDLDYNNEVDFDSSLSDEMYRSHDSLNDYYTWHDYKEELLNSYWRNENALRLFLSKRLIKSSSVDYNKVKANNQMIAKYKEITDPAQYKDAEKTKALYQSVFIRQYENTIDYKWNSQIYQKSNYHAQERGEYYFTKALKVFAYKLGYYNSYSRNYKQTSQVGYQKTIATAYTNSFNETVNYYSRNPVLENLDINIINQDQKDTFSPIDTIYPVLTHLVNVGKVTGKLTIKIKENSSIISNNQTLEFEIPGLKSLAQPQVLDALAQVSTAAEPDTKSEIIFQTNVGNQKVILKTLWNQTVKQVAQDSADRQKILVQYLSFHLGKEMENMKKLFKKNKYKSEPENTFAGKLVLVYQSLTPAERAILNNHQKSIVQGIGKRPTNFICIGCGKAEWDSAQKIFKQIGWSLPR
ncbi:MAG: hypothetical protein KDD45_16325, partial [Bdellovibrionales bacterium]|nr:hypothetical protein [Bdellovibrionales bacterium]